MSLESRALAVALIGSATALTSPASAQLSLTPAADLSQFFSKVNAPKFVPGQPLPPGTQPPPEYAYREGDLLPTGYHIEARPRTGFLVTGYLVGGIPWGLGVLSAATAGFENESGWLALPVLGPWLTLSQRTRACNEIGDTAVDSPHCFGDRTAEWFMGASGVLQAVGMTFVLLGYTMTKPYAVRDSWSYAVIPTWTGDGAGIAAIGHL